MTKTKNETVTPMPEVEEVQYRPLEGWQVLSLTELDEAYALVPTQRQQYYREVLEREAGKVNAVTDAEELQVVQALLARFEQDALVPIGARWAKPPQRVKAAAMQGEPLTAPEDVYLPKSNGMPNPLLLMAAVGGLFLCLLLVVLMASGGGDETEATLSAVNPYASPTLRYTVTPTPIALEEQDTIIKDGDRDSSRTLAYPVGLQIYPSGEWQPRVFVVQRRAVEYSEWEYDPNPDTASYLLGMSVRRVVGVPWSEENEDLFNRLSDGAVFHLILNTGAVIEYRFEHKTEVRRSDTAAFRQIAPGLVLVLIGELDDEGAPTATRLLVVGRYEAEQELTREGFLSTDVERNVPIATPTPIFPTATPLPARDLLYVELVSVVFSPDGYLVTKLRFYNGQYEPVTLYPDDIQIAFGNQPSPPGPWAAASSLEEMTILPGQAGDLTITWAWEGKLAYATLQILGYTFSIAID
ncbi:MAG: hypothetical protein BroJett018_20620 [Chloroflexota bacterium]|nr:MAG: hypothetical protein BroJett018_20620 [Chloroflexota bacterium]